MTVLRIEHSVMDFERWKQAFDSDPAGRERSGVREYRLLRQVDDPNYVMIDLEFDTPKEAEGLLTALRGTWAQVQGKLIEQPTARIVDEVETHRYLG